VLGDQHQSRRGDQMQRLAVATELCPAARRGGLAAKRLPPGANAQVTGVRQFERPAANGNQ
jgi:hypothetical protein